MLDRPKSDAFSNGLLQKTDKPSMKGTLKITYLLCLLVFSLSESVLAAPCAPFDTALEKALAKVTSRDAAKAQVTSEKVQGWGRAEAQSYKLKYTALTVRESDNRNYLKLADIDKKLKREHIVYFDVENAAQKKLNDAVIRDKGMVDAINNSFIDKFNTNLSADPLLKKSLQGNYQDYKSLRLRLIASTDEEAASLQQRLNAVYKKTNDEFVSEFQERGLTKLIAPRTDETVDISTWFLSGSGNTPLEANMAARSARTSGFANGNATTMSFAKQVDNLHADVFSIEGLRKSLAADSSLIKSGVMAQSDNGSVIPTKEMIGILRKIKLSDCDSVADFYDKIRKKTKSLIGADLKDSHIESLTKYFDKVDSLSPPLFQRSRETIDLGKAKNGIVSVDFTGVGVDNAYEQMKGLGNVNYSQSNKRVLLKDAFDKIQGNVDSVTEEMNKAKRIFSYVTKDPAAPKVMPVFSGDDGILMPAKNWADGEKKEVLKALSKAHDPSKFRVTFTKTEYLNGTSVPIVQRSARIVRAEEIEKSLRELVTGHDKITPLRAKQMIFAIDSTPLENGGRYKLYIGGLKPTVEERKLIEESFLKGIPMKSGEAAERVIDINDG